MIQVGVIISAMEYLLRTLSINVQGIGNVYNTNTIKFIHTQHSFSNWEWILNLF